MVPLSKEIRHSSEELENDITYRYWDHKDKRWYYHSSKDPVSTEETGSTGGLVVVVLIILLTLYSLRRLWVVWAEILNFDGVGWSQAIETFLFLA